MKMSNKVDCMNTCDQFKAVQDKKISDDCFRMIVDNNGKKGDNGIRCGEDSSKLNNITSFGNSQGCQKNGLQKTVASDIKYISKSHAK